MTNYETAINSLLPAAERFADTNAGDTFWDRSTGWRNKKYRDHEEWADAWNRFYHSEMSRLAYDAGMRNMPVRGK